MPAGQAKRWLPVTQTVSAGSRYYHFHLVEDLGAWDGARNEIIAYFQKAHADAIQRLENLTTITLHPAGIVSTSPYAGYPHKLPQVTLQGYFGEVMAGWFAETGSPSGLPDWNMPAHLFRFHLTAFQYLERQSQTGSVPSAIVGRTGDDCLAFRRNSSGVITDILYCEAKCTSTHDASLIRDAHDKASSSAIADIPQLIEILSCRNDADAQAWVKALREFYLSLFAQPNSGITRHDLVCYVHSQAPQQRTTWIPATTVHACYTANRVLNAVELRLANVIERLEAVYAAEVWE
jgi:hypothetical protein